MTSIFITNEIIESEGAEYGGIFSDRVAIDIHTKDLYVDVRGQWQGRRDHLVDESIADGLKIHIFTRNKKTDTFTHQGVAEFVYKDTRTAQIGVKPETVNDLAFYHFVIKACDVVNEKIPRNPLFNGGGCLKKACLQRIGHPNPDGAGIFQCFVKN
jgi:hypothetical protein